MAPFEPDVTEEWDFTIDPRADLQRELYRVGFALAKLIAESPGARVTRVTITMARPVECIDEGS